MIMNNKGNDMFQTPDNLFKQLNDIYTFTVDSACCSYNCKLSYGFYFDKDKDGLKENWSGHRVFCNPPFSNKADWIKKAHDEVLNNNCNICVMVLPTNCLDSIAWHTYIEGKFTYEILRGRVSFINPESGKPQTGNNAGTVIIYFKKKIVR